MLKGQHTSWRESLPWQRLRQFNPRFEFSGYWLAVISVFVAFLVRLLIDPWLGDQMPYLTFVVAIAATGLYAGVRPAILSTVLGAVTAYFCFVPPRYKWGFAGASDAVGFAVYLSAAAGVVFLTLARNHAAAKAEESLKEQIEAERKLLDARSLLKSFLDHGPACAYLRDEDGQYVYLNEMAKRLFGFEEEDASRASIASQLEQNDRRLGRSDREILQAGHPQQSVDKIAAPDGNHYWLTVKFPFIDQNGKKFVGGSSFEITERVQAEEILRKTERLAASGQMASLLSHHINNPLAAVTNCLYLLSGETLTQAGREYVSQATEELARVNRIAGLTFGLYAENEKPGPVPICAVIDEVTEALSALPAFQHVRIERDFQCDASVLGSGPGIRQLFTSLLANAMESNAKTIRIRVVHGRDWRRLGMTGIRIRIADDGHGIARKNYQHLFQPFFSTKGTRGTGLGLWLSRAIILKNDGAIKIRSVSAGLRTGTCVSLFLPTVKAGANFLNSLSSKPSLPRSATQIDLEQIREHFASTSDAHLGL